MEDNFLIDELVKGGFLISNLDLSNLQSRRCEQLSWRYALLKLLKKNNIDFCELEKNENGAPFLKSSSCFISVSHTKNMVCVALNKSQAIGIDIQEYSSKIQAIQHKFLIPNELIFCQNQVVLLTRAWTIKEAVYKLVQKPGISLKEIEIQDFNSESYAKVMVENTEIICFSLTKNNLCFSIVNFYS